MVHRMVAARVCGPHHDGRRHANKNEDLWESVHCVVGSDLGLVLVHAWFYEGDRQTEWGHKRRYHGLAKKNSPGRRRVVP